MSLKLSLKNVTGGSSSRNQGSGKGKTISYGRVIDIILDENHPQYLNQGGGISINGVFFKPLTSNVEEQTGTQLPFAYQQSAQFKTVPLVGEIVQVEPLPVPSDNDFSNKTRKYYTRTLNVWNSPNSNFYPDTTNNLDIDFSQGDKFLELPTVNPIGAAPGDILLEGRQGQSIRFTGSRSISNPFIDSSNLGKPVTIISNGQKETEDGFTTIGEDVNLDDCSIYMVSDHKIPLSQSSDKRSTWDEKPEKSDQFKGNQVMLNAGRLFFNAKEHDIQLSSVKAVGITTTGTVNIDATKYMCLDGSEIYLGEKARTASGTRKEPILLGNQVENFLNTLLNMLDGMADDMAQAITIDGKPIPNLNKRGLQAKPTILALRNQINPNGPSKLKSKKVFSE